MFTDVEEAYTLMWRGLALLTKRWTDLADLGFVIDCPLQATLREVEPKVAVEVKSRMEHDFVHGKAAPKDQGSVTITLEPDGSLEGTMMLTVVLRKNLV